MKRGISSWPRIALAIGLLAVMPLGVEAAERVVLGEYFTALW